MKLLKVLKNIYKINSNQYNNYLLGRWNSVHKKEYWERLADMANYDNCCCSFTLNDKNKQDTKNKQYTKK
jgi:hypothetical protein